jgi:hypothetical protein
MSKNIQNNSDILKPLPDLDARLLYIESAVLAGLSFKIDENSPVFIDTFNKIFYTIVEREQNKPVNVVNNIIIKEIIKFITKNESTFTVKPKPQETITNPVEQVKQPTWYNSYVLYSKDNDKHNENAHILGKDCKNITIQTLEYFPNYNITEENNNFVFRELIPSEKILLSDEKIMKIESGLYTLNEFIDTFNYTISQLETQGQYRLFYDKITSKFVLESHNISTISSLSMLKTIQLDANKFIIDSCKNPLNSILGFETYIEPKWLYSSKNTIKWVSPLENDYFHLLINDESVYIGVINDIHLPIEIELDGLVNIKSIKFKCSYGYISTTLLKLKCSK